MEGSYNTPEGAVPSSAVRNLVRAVLEALDIPHPAAGGREAHDRILSERAMHAAIALRNTLDGWTKTAEEILDSLARFCRRISGASH